MPVARQASAEPYLLVRSGAAIGTSFPVRDGLTIGRHPLNDVCLRDGGVKPHHAVVRQAGGAWTLEDLAGESPPVRLSSGETVKIGPVQLEWSIGAPPPRPPRHSRTITTALPSPAEVGVGFQDPTGLDAKALEKVLSFEASLAEVRDFDPLIDTLLDWVQTTIPAHNISVLLRDDRGRLRSLRSRSRDRAKAPAPSRSIVEQAVREHMAVLILDAPEDDRVRHGQSIIVQNIRSALCVPLVARGEVIGAIYAVTQGMRAAFDEGHLRLLTLIAGPVAGAVQSALLVRELSDTNRDLLRRLSICARFNDDDTGYHIQRVGEYAAALAAAVGQAPPYCARLRAAAPMHDIGKIGIPQSILQKPGKLTADEFGTMKRHTLIGEEILGGSRAPLIRLAAELAGSHHEKWDGSGYPRGLEEEAIPLSGRIVAVADVFDALLTKRCYKPAFELDRALSIIEEGAGGHFDPTIVQTFFNIIDEILAIRKRYANLEAHQAERLAVTG